MKKQTQIFLGLIFVCVSLFTLGCSKQNERLDDGPEKGLIIKSENFLNKSSISKEVINKRVTFNENRIRSLQEELNLDGFKSGEVTIMEQNCDKEMPGPAGATALSEVPVEKSYSASPVSSGGKVVGYILNAFKGGEIYSVYQEVKFDDDGKKVGFVLWSDDNKFIWSTDDDLYKPTSIDLINNKSIGTMSEGYGDCVARVFGEAKSACEADNRCDLMCSLTPGCHACMAAAAAAVCL